MSLTFDLLGQDDRARRGQVTTAHGTVDTPAFMPVGTCGTVKAMMPESVAATGAQILLGNTYHLMLRPGAERVRDFGGLHRFMNWDKPILTDSGGFQVMSLSGRRKLTEQGVLFSSHIDGTKYNLTPERSVEIQHLLDSNITMQLDECPPFPIDEAASRASMEMSVRWAQRCKDVFDDRAGYGLFGIVQGSVFEDQREQSAKKLQDIGFDGYAIGGLAVGEGQELMFSTLEKTIPHMTAERPRYLMGVGRPDDIIGAVLRGVDMFDCVMPTRSGRTAQAFTRMGPLNIRNARFADDKRPIDPECLCPACRHYTRGYLHHLFRTQEILAPMLLTWHNIQLYQDVMQSLRAAIMAGNTKQIAASWLAGFANDDPER